MTTARAPAARRLLAAIVLAAFPVVLGGCMLTMPDPLLKPRTLEKGAVPALRGNWKDGDGNELTVTPARGSSNTFTLKTVQGDGALTATLERLDPDRFVLQLSPEEGRGVFLTVAEVTERRIAVYTYPDSLLEDIRKAAERNGVAVTDKGLITGFTSPQGVVAFFRELAAMPGHEDVVYTKK
jgi:hypothetical protein